MGRKQRETALIPLTDAQVLALCHDRGVEGAARGGSTRGEVPRAAQPPEAVAVNSARTYPSGMRRGPRYRWQTALRGVLPSAFAGLVPRGADCRAHEWHRKDVGADACY